MIFGFGVRVEGIFECSDVMCFYIFWKFYGGCSSKYKDVFEDCVYIRSKNNIICFIFVKV